MPYIQTYIAVQKLLQFLALMLPKREVLVRLLRSNTSFLLYGQKASGKTTLINSLLKETNSKYIEINCTLANKKANFLKLFNVELNKYLGTLNIPFTFLTNPNNLDSWINDLKRVINSQPDFIDHLDNLYIFMDNIEEMVMSEVFLPSFYSACQKQFDCRFSFIFCGINFLKKQYTLELPFRTMIAFCMPKPIQESEHIITKTVEQIFRRQLFKDKNDQAQLQKCIKVMVNNIKSSFENIEFNLQKLKTITKAIVDAMIIHIDPKQPHKTLLKLVNTHKLKDTIHQVRQFGPMQQDMMKRKINSLENQQTYDINLSLEYYPNLILTSIHLADYYTEKEDKRRFQDYKGRSNHRNKDLKKSDFKIGRHNINRIIAISQALQSQAKDNDKEKMLQHHSLDYYAQFQHLRKINRIKYNGNKVTGIVKEEDARAFLSKYELKYEQFMSN